MLVADPTTPVQVPDSVLDTTKKMLGFDYDYTAFDLDIITLINSVFFTLNQLGVGEPNFLIEDNTKTWAEFQAGENLSAVKAYMFLKVRIIFDPPANSFTQEAMNKQATEYEWRLNAYREGVKWRESQIPTIS